MGYGFLRALVCRINKKLGKRRFSGGLGNTGSKFQVYDNLMEQ